MTSYIPAFISRRFSRPGAESEARPVLDIAVAANDDAISNEIGQGEGARGGEQGLAAIRAEQQNAALERVLAGDHGHLDVLSPMSISTPSEDDLRRIDQDRLAQAPVSTITEEGTRNRGSTDPLPRRPGGRAVAEDLRRGSWQARIRNSNAILSGVIENAANPRAGAAGFVDDPSRSRSVRASISSNMSLSSSGPATPDGESKGPMMLPEDDGMRATRVRIQAVQALDVSLEEKSRLMHLLMTERYNSHHVKTHREVMREGALGRQISPARASVRSARSQDAPLTPKSEVSATMDGLAGPNGEALASPSTSVFTTTSELECYVSADDLKPTYYSKKTDNQSKSQTQSCTTPPNLGDEDLLGPAAEEDKPLGCPHYMRNVKLQCHACLAWYTCRFCHDEVEDHNLERRKTRNMLCMLCGTAQPAAHNCRSCGEEAAVYYCDVCKLWDNDSRKSIYHCEDCGICRVGQGVGKDFFHCKVCDVCISMGIRDSHKCIERSVDCDCPICGEYMFTSPQTVVFMRCGHSIHHTCYKQHLETSFKCPICSKSIMNMDISFRHLDHAIAAQPMPEGFRDTKALVVCNDCRGKSSVPYHWLGLKCAECDSYNTAQLQLIGPNEQSAGDSVVSPHEDPMSGTGTPGLQSGMQTGFHTPRGRSDSSLRVLGRSRRPTSTSAIQDLRMPLGADYFYPITNEGRSLSAMGTDRMRPGWVGNGEATAPMDMDGDGDGDDEDEMDFWGGDASPRLLSPRRGAQVDDEESDSSEDDAMEDPEDDDGDDDDEGMMDDLDVFGHR